MGYNHIEINRIAFGKTSTIIEYESNPNYIEVSKIEIDGKLYEKFGCSGFSGSDNNWKCIANLKALENPNKLEIY